MRTSCMRTSFCGAGAYSLRLDDDKMEAVDILIITIQRAAAALLLLDLLACCMQCRGSDAAPPLSLPC